MKKIVFITGASQGLGKYTAIEFARRQYNLFLTGRNLEALKQVQTEIVSKFQVQCFVHQLDVTKLQDWEKVKSCYFENYDKMDILLLNAGISNPLWFEQFDLQNFRDTYETNLFGVLNGLHTFLPYFLERRSGIIAVVSSLADSRGFVGSSSYTSSKIALSYIAESASIELAEKNIKVINIRPGFVRTNMTAKNKYPMPFLMEPQNAAKIIVDGIEKGKSVISFPWITNFLTKVIKITPRFIYEPLIRSWKRKQKN